MKQHRLSATKRLTKPLLYGTLLVALASAFVYRHSFFEDVAELRALERARNYARGLEILENRQRQMEELAAKKRGSS